MRLRRAYLSNRNSRIQSVVPDALQSRQKAEESRYPKRSIVVPIDWPSVAGE